MVCENFTTGADLILDAPVEAVWCVFQTSVGPEFTVGVTGGAIAVSYYIHGQSWIVPAVLLVMMGGVLTPQIPVGVIGLVYFLLSTAFGAAILWLIHRSQDQP